MGVEVAQAAATDRARAAAGTSLLSAADDGGSEASCAVQAAVDVHDASLKLGNGPAENFHNAWVANDANRTLTCKMRAERASLRAQVFARAYVSVEQAAYEAH